MANVGFKITRNDITPQLGHLAAAIKHPQPVLRAMGTTFMSITMGNFNDAGAAYRPVPWKPKKDGRPSKLQKSGTLSRSFHLDVTSEKATVSTPVIYGATHQFGRAEANIPARPFFPVTGGSDSEARLTPPAAEKIIAAGQRMIERQAGI